VLLPVGGRLCDALGAVRAFALGMAGFAGASLAIGLAADGTEVVVARGLAGCAAALLMPAALAILVETFPSDRRAVAFAVYTGVGQGSAALGPTVGGLCAQFAGRRWGFLVNVVVGVVGLGLLARARPRNVVSPVVAWDVPGVALLVAASGLSVLAFLQAPEWGWLAPVTLACAGAGAVAAVAFVRRCRSRRDPVVDPRLFRDRTFTGGTLVLDAGARDRRVAAGFAVAGLVMLGAAALAATMLGRGRPPTG
jgi:MFS family permease